MMKSETFQIALLL